jgi:hypothetical protein
LADQHHHVNRRSCTYRDPAVESSSDLVNRHFTVEGPNRLWVTGTTEHPTIEGTVYGGDSAVDWLWRQVAVTSPMMFSSLLMRSSVTRWWTSMGVDTVRFPCQEVAWRRVRNASPANHSPVRAGRWAPA